MSTTDGVKRLLLRVVPVLVLGWMAMSLSQSKDLPAQITLAQLLTGVSVGLVGVALYRALIIFWNLSVGRDDEPDLDPSLRGGPDSDQLNEMAVNVLSHELAHAVVSHRLGLEVWSVTYSPFSGDCHSNALRRTDDTVYWAGRATICAAGLLAPVGKADRADQHGNPSLQDDALALWRMSAYIAAADGQSITHHADQAMQRARELMPEMAEIRRAAQRLMVPPAKGWRLPSPSKAVPKEDLQAFLRDYDPSADT